MNAIIDELAAILAMGRTAPSGFNRQGREPVIIEPHDLTTAKALLERLLMPSQQMIDAACHYGPEDFENSTPDAVAEDIFRDMIQAALDQFRGSELP